MFTDTNHTINSNRTFYRFRYNAGFLFILLTFLLLLNSCKKQQYFYIEGYAQGTTFHITYQGNDDYSRDIEAILRNFDLSLSTYNDSSIISRINKNDPAVIPDTFFIKVFKKSQEVYNNTDGMFDITVGPIVKAWGFLKDTTIHPDSVKIKKLLNYVGMNKIRLENNKIIKDFPETTIDVNAIAQGFSVDIVSDFLEKKGIKNYLVEIGGEIKNKGFNSQGKPWKMGVDKPVDGNNEEGEEIQSIIELSNKAISTSGNYRSYYIENNVKYTHTINPKTGYPVKSNLLSATIVANDCMTADAYATACMVVGLDKSKELLKKIKGLQGLLIYSDSLGNLKTYSTEGLKKFIK